MQQDHPLDALGRRLENVAEREDAGVVDEYLDVDAHFAHRGVEFVRRLRAGEVHCQDVHLSAGRDVSRGNLVADPFERRGGLPDQHQVVACGGQA